MCCVLNWLWKSGRPNLSKYDFGFIYFISSSTNWIEWEKDVTKKNWTKSVAVELSGVSLSFLWLKSKENKYPCRVEAMEGSLTEEVDTKSL